LTSINSFYGYKLKGGDMKRVIVNGFIKYIKDEEFPKKGSQMLINRRIMKLLSETYSSDFALEDVYFNDDFVRCYKLYFYDDESIKNVYVKYDEDVEGKLKVVEIE
jgi:hypothetical protein